ncbi:MAG: rac-like GTP-binding protein isoform, partial [Rickettsiaceae bacterium]|nr:rac-like GTP-binding protein isoform [Rickettsiaceae bacterium]
MEARYDDYPLPRRESAANREIKLSFVGSRINAKLTSGTREIDGNQFNVSIQRSILFTRAGAYSTEKPDAYVLTFDITDRASFNSVSKIVADITKENPSKPIILVGVNNHLRQAAHVTNAQGQELANKIGAAKYIECNINDPEKLAEVINAAVRATSHALPITTRQAAQSNVISLNPASAPDQAHRPLESNNSGRVDTENEWLTTIITTLNKKPLADRPLLLNQMAKSFADSAREAVTPEEKERIFNALQALKLANAITSAELEETQEQQAQSINRTPATASSSATPQNVDTADATMRAYQQQQEKLAQLQKMRVEGKLTPEQERALAVFEQKQAQQAGTTIPTSSGSNHSQ